MAIDQVAVETPVPVVPSGDDITLNKDGGILKTIIRAGTSDECPAAGDNVSVHYVGTLLDGSQFDSSRDRGEKFQFEVGKGSVIKGWDQGIPTMKKGELSRFFIRADYGYGKKGSGSKIGPDATLVFDIELFDFHGEDISESKDGSIVRRILQAGEGYSSPNEGARVVIDVLGKELVSGRVFDKRENVEFEIGEGAASNVCEGIEQALIKFKKSEKAQISIKSRHAWGSEGHKEFALAEYTDVVYEVTLKSFEKTKESWQLNAKEKLEQSELLKNKGTELFKAGKFESAIKKYKKITEFLSSETFDSEEEKETSNKMQLAANLNIAMCSLKVKSYRDVIEACEKALSFDAKNEKGLFRMAQAYFGLSEYSLALKFYNEVLAVNPASKEASVHIAHAKLKVKEETDREKSLYTKMLSAISK